MSSSGDELGSYGQSPRVIVSGMSKTNARPGPSKPKLKKATASETVEGTNHKTDPVNTIAISSDEEDVRPTRRGRAAAGTDHPAPNGRATSSRGKGKATAKRKKIVDVDDAGLVEDTAAETDADDPTSRRDTVRHATKTKIGNNNDLLRKQNERLQKQLEDVSSQRDSVSTQLEQLFQLRHTEAEAQLAEQRAQYEASMKAKEDTIHELQSSLSHVDKLSKTGATTTLHFLTRETADEEKQDVQREVAKLEDSLKKKDAIIHARDIELDKLNETIRLLRADLKTEIENTQALTARKLPSSATKHASKSSDTKSSQVVRLYEELTNLLVTNVRHEPGLFREDDAIYTCVQTTSTGKSLNFSLKFCKDAAEGETPSSANRNGRTVDKVVYRPQELDKETPEFVQQLDFLAKPFTFQKEQMGVFTKTLLTYLEGDAEDSQSNTDQMEVEDD